MEAVLNNISLKFDKSDWKLVSFGDVVAEPRATVKNAAAEGIEHVVGLEHIDTENIHLRRSAGIEESTTFTKKFEKEDVLFGRRRAYLKKAAQAAFGGICSGDITVLRAKKDLLPELLPFVVNNDKFFDYAVKHSAGGLSPRVKFKDLANYQFLLPPKDQQARLAELLWAMDEMMEWEREVMEGLENLLVSLEFDVFSHTLNCRLGQVVKKCLSGGTPDTSKESFYDNGNINWITTKTLNTEYIDKGEKLITEDAIQNSAAKVLPEDNILAGTRVGVGKFAINNICMSFSQDITGLIINKEIVDLEFLVYQLNSIVIQRMIGPLMRGTTIKGILKDDLLNLKISLPSIQTQRKIRSKLKRIKDALDISKSKHNEAYSLQKSLINQIF